MSSLARNTFVFSATTQRPNPLTPGWKQWVAENRLRNCTPASMVETMVNAGIDRLQATHAVDTIHHDPCYRAAERFLQINRKYASVMANLQKLWELAPNYDQVEKRPYPGHDEFVKQYCLGNRPVVLTGLAADWPAMQRWTPQFFKEQYGNVEVEIQAGRNDDADYERNKLQHRSRIAMAEFVDRVMAVGASNDIYLTANNDALRRAELAPLLDDIGSLPKIINHSRFRDESSLWFGPAGTVTPLHHDTIMLFHTQIKGRKRWRFISPLETPNLYNFSGVFSPIDLDNVDLSRFPDFAKVKVLEVVVEEGETVFLPLGWWHQVTSLDVCISLSFSCLTFPNEYAYDNPAIPDW
jgi:hypothetical protein